MAPQARLHGIPNCDTVKKARAWLQGRGVAHEFVDLKKTPPDAALLAGWARAVGIERLLNRKGTTWRALGGAAQAAAGTEAGALALMAAQPSVIKRPVVQWPDGALTVGFDEADWSGRLDR
ncbi:MAG: Spx/MgsR family RNA polymerase-binding regulatory protein [Betaproteobacteria bacterium]|jgi:arsenate reductase